tara:strand:- start:2234 stop:2398 length:165 start_codon:yes stop_codon:yes gene_type:complete
MTTADTLAKIANETEAALLDAMPAEMREWYLNLPRSVRVEMARNAFAETAAALK